MTIRVLIIAALTMLPLLLPEAALASGSYSGRPPRPPSAMDRASYELGKQVFAGEYAPSARPGEEASQQAILSELQEKLPRSASAKVDLPSHAGKLSDEQLEALRYFLKKRYKVR